jgi:hypothetical protein
MGNVSADGKCLWASGRYDNVVYAFDISGELKSVTVGTGAAPPRGMSAAGR